MFRRLSQVRSNEKRPTLAAFFTLLTFMVAHTILETARDALFLARIPAERLPWVYLAIAGVALVATQLQERFAHKLGGRRQISGLFFGAAVVTAALWFPLGGELADERALYGVYVWSGLLATLALIQFWSLMSDLFTVSQAKRIYAVVGTGSVAGAILGSGLAGLLATLIDARHLLLAAAGALFVTGLVAMVGLRSPESGEKRVPCRQRRSASKKSKRAPGFFESAAAVLGRPYPKRVALLVFTSTIALTIGDFLFKSTVAERVAPEHLGTFFAASYFGLNILSLLVQVGLVGVLVRRCPLAITLSILPAFLLLGGATFFVIGGLVSAIAVKGADGALRHSLHRTASELLYVPMANRRRRQLKTFIDVVGQRGGQALASLLILGAVASLGADHLVIALAGFLVALCFGWLVAAWDLEGHYFDLFRRTLRNGIAETEASLPDLDVSSLESWIAALNSPEDGYVLAGIDLLAREGKADLIPALILYHPSHEVVEAALTVFVDAERDDFVTVADRIFERAAPLTRAALLRARNAVAPDEAITRTLLAEHEDCPITQATALVILLSNGWASEGDRERLEALAATDDPISRYAVAQAIRYVPQRECLPLLRHLAGSDDVAVLTEVAIAIGTLGDIELLPDLLHLLSRRQLITPVSEAIAALGPAALSRLDAALGDEAMAEVHRRIPNVMAQFAPTEASRLLLAHLDDSRHDGMVRLKVLKALEQVRRMSPEVAIDRRAIDAAIASTIAEGFQWIALREGLAGADHLRTRQNGADGATATPAEPGESRVRALLLRLLEGKEQHAIDRALRLVGLAHSGEEMARIRRGLRARSAAVRSSSRELLEALTTGTARDGLLALVDDADRATRLASAGRLGSPLPASHVEALAQCLGSSSVAVRSLAAAYVGELGLGELENEVRAMAEGPSASRVTSVVDRVLGLLRPDDGLAYET